MHREKPGELEEEMQEVNGGGEKSFDIFDSSEKMIVILRDRWWLQTTKQEGG